MLKVVIITKISVYSGSRTLSVVGYNDAPQSFFQSCLYTFIDSAVGMNTGQGMYMRVYQGVDITAFFLLVDIVLSRLSKV